MDNFIRLLEASKKPKVKKPKYEYRLDLTYPVVGFFNFNFDYEAELANELKKTKLGFISGSGTGMGFQDIGIIFKKEEDLEKLLWFVKGFMKKYKFKNVHYIATKQSKDHDDEILYDEIIK